MTRRTQTLLIAAAALGCASLSLAPAVAGTKCKVKAVSIGAISQDQAISAWSNKVKNSYGAAWSNYSLARDKNWSEKQLGVATMYFVTAVPCRRD